jgi:NTE family protein
MKNALILAGGGVAGIAWELGVLRGLQDSDPGLAARVLAADLVVGTSAGSAVAAQITSGVPLDDLYGRQLSETSAEIEVQLDMEQLLARFTAAVSATASPDEALRAIGALALDTETVAEPVRMTAVAASCAVPGIWPPVTINGRRYIDGGVRSPTNADLAAGYDRILIITPADPDQPVPFGALDEEIDRLKPGRVHVVPADAPSLAAFGTNPLSPATRGPAARAGREVGRAHAAEVAALWD